MSAGLACSDDSKQVKTTNGSCMVLCMIKESHLAAEEGQGVPRLGPLSWAEGEAVDDTVTGCENRAGAGLATQELNYRRDLCM